MIRCIHMDAATIGEISAVYEPQAGHAERDAGAGSRQAQRCLHKLPLCAVPLTWEIRTWH